MIVEINGNAAVTTGEHDFAAVEAKQFKDLMKDMDPRFNVRSIDFRSVDFARSKAAQVRFINFKADVRDPKGEPLSGVVFMRGGSVAILVILRCEGREYVLLTLQPRFPTGNYQFPEIPAGTMEADGTFAGNAAREIEEETGMRIREKDLIDLTDLVYGARYKGVYPTPGGSDEYLKLFVYIADVSLEFLRGLAGKQTGLPSENEQITLKVVSIEHLVDVTPDAKALSALMLYERVRRMGII